MKIRVDILFRHQLWGDALQSLINQSDPFLVQHVFPVTKGTIPEFTRPSLIVFEILHLDPDVLEIIRNLKNSGHQVILVGFLSTNTLLNETLDSGLDGYVLKTSSQENLMMALHEVSQNKKYFCSSIAEVLNNQLHSHQNNGKNDLTGREKKILNALIELKTPKQISQTFHISESTVRTHRKNIMRKIGAKDVLSLLMYACSEGLLCRDKSDPCISGQ
ncbi:response regulator transcription factor [Marinilabilia sp.]|uniref:response regulator transcription factor n=1 Tax=Marinilabilia sp. TaxID=2021252 RepID=UPI0025BC1B50|nr:response regulator transcription factor [Marinilabilia sp.]